MVFAYGQPATDAYLLIDGVIEIFQQRDDGHSIVVRLLEGLCLFGELEVATDERHYLASMRVLDHAIVHRIKRQHYRDILRKQPSAALEALVAMSEAFCRVAATETARLFETDVQLAAALLAYAELFGERCKEGTRILLRRSQADLSEAVGASERQVQRVLKQWASRRWIDKVDGRYVIVNREALRRVARGYDEGLLSRGSHMPQWIWQV